MDDFAADVSGNGPASCVSATSPATPNPCCTRCAQLYKHHPDLRCDPEYREGGETQVFSRKEVMACKNCRAYKVKCEAVPKAHQNRLATLQSAARHFSAVRNDSKLAAAAFYRLRAAQALFNEASRARNRDT